MLPRNSMHMSVLKDKETVWLAGRRYFIPNIYLLKPISQFVERYHMTEGCALNMEDLIWNNLKNSVRNKRISNILMCTLYYRATWLLGQPVYTEQGDSSGNVPTPLLEIADSEYRPSCPRFSVISLNLLRQTPVEHLKENKQMPSSSSPIHCATVPKSSTVWANDSVIK
jgi:hypothetical protein